LIPGCITSQIVD